MTKYVYSVAQIRLIGLI